MASRFLLGVTLMALLMQSPLDATMLRRFVLVAGANDGGKDRVSLRYAVSDAESFVQVLESMGGVDPDDVILIRDATRDRFESALEELQQRVADVDATDTRREIIVYYSGHADDRGLLLGEDLFSYQDLRARVDAVQADVHITVLDACASGAITRLKGGQRRQAFLVDESSQARGYAFLTSSSEDEAAQESDKIGASYFTHYLVSGVRGAADATADGKVTLGEAYQFAFHETLATTERSQVGAQHPAYDISLAGTGDVVMTDVSQTSASLRFGEALDGRLFIRNSKQQLVAEVYKTPGRVMEFGLEPDLYEVTFDQSPGRFQTTVSLQDGDRLDILPQDMTALDPEATVSRGASSAGSRSGFLSAGIMDRVEVPFGGLQLSLISNEAVDSTGSQVSLAYNRAYGRVGGFQFSAGLNRADGEVRAFQLGGLANVAGRARLQLGGVVNIAEERVDGAQFSVVNAARSSLP